MCSGRVSSSCSTCDTRRVNTTYACKKSLKIPKGQSESVYRRTDTKWPNEKVQKDKQRSTKHTHKTKDRVTRTPLKTGVNSGAPEVTSSRLLVYSSTNKTNRNDITEIFFLSGVNNRKT